MIPSPQKTHQPATSPHSQLCGRNIPPNPDAVAPALTSRIVLSHAKDDVTLNLAPFYLQKNLLFQFTFFIFSFNFFFLFSSSAMESLIEKSPLNPQNVAATAPSRFNKVGLYAPSQSWGESPMNQQTVAYVGSKTTTPLRSETSLLIPSNASLLYPFPNTDSFLLSFFFFLNIFMSNQIRNFEISTECKVGTLGESTKIWTWFPSLGNGEAEKSDSSIFVFDCFIFLSLDLGG